MTVAASGADEAPQEWKNAIGIEFMLIAAGTFRMGVSGLGCKDPYATPAHDVTIIKPFYIGNCEVTQEGWQAVVGTHPSHCQRSRDGALGTSRRCAAIAIRDWSPAARLLGWARS